MIYLRNLLIAIVMICIAGISVVVQFELFA